MDNKPIINGIDVSECKYFNKVVNEEPYCNIDEEHLYTCSSDENCYYKQLKRLQEENEKLKADLKGETEQAQKWYQLETYKHFQILKYEQALKEIRNIAETPIITDKNRFDEITNKINEALNDN